MVTNRNLQASKMKKSDVDLRLLRKFRRVVSVMGLFQLAHADMGVDFSGFKVGMTEHGLDISDVTAVLKQQRGKGVPE